MLIFGVLQNIEDHISLIGYTPAWSSLLPDGFNRATHQYDAANYQVLFFYNIALR